MNTFEKTLYALQASMKMPTSFGWFHWVCILITLATIFFLYQKRKQFSEKQLKTVLLTYAVIALILEIVKQIVWSFQYNPVANSVIWSYRWYAAPFPLCTTPMYACLIAAFLKNNKFKTALLSYVSFVTILGSIITICLPISCFTTMIISNIHTMWLHCGSFVVSIYLLFNNVVTSTKQNFYMSIKVFLYLVMMALILNIGVYHLNVLNGSEFNMFYISPYFISTLPVFNEIQKNTPYIVFLSSYILALSFGAGIVYQINRTVKHSEYVGNRKSIKH